MPHPSLHGLVTPYVGYAFDADGTLSVHRGLPSTEATVVLALAQPLDVGWWDQPTSRRREWGVASGLNAMPAEIRQRGWQAGIQFGLTPEGCRALLAAPLAALAADIVSLDAAVPPPLRDLPARLAQLGSWEARFDLLDAVLATQARRWRADRPGVGRSEVAFAWRQLLASDGGSSIEGLAREVGWSRRHLGAQFQAELGVTPKQVARIARFQRSRQALAAGAGIADAAAVSGFADQPHLTREWRALGAATPAQWLREEFSFLQDLAEPQSPGSGHDR